MSDDYLRLLRERTHAIESQIASLQEELSELVIAERVHQRLAVPIGAESAKPENLRVINLRAGTAKSLILQYLRDIQEPWATPPDVLEGASKLKGSPIPSGTIYPSMSELVRDNLIVRENGKVALPQRLPIKEASNENPRPQAIPRAGDQTGAV